MRGNLLKGQCLLSVLMASGGIMNSTAAPNTSKLTEDKTRGINERGIDCSQYCRVSRSTGHVLKLKHRLMIGLYSVMLVIHVY